MIIIFLIVYPAILIWTIVLIIRNWMKSSRAQFSEDPKSAMLVIFGILFTVIAPALGFWRYDQYTSLGIPFAPEHVLSLELPVIVSALSYWISRFYKRKLSFVPLLLVRAGLIQGIAICFFTSIHFVNFYSYGLIWVPLGFELLAPPIAFLFLLYECIASFRMDGKTAARASTPAWQLMQQGLPVILVVTEQALLLPFGYQWNSLLLTFTQSHGFIFSA